MTSTLDTTATQPDIEAAFAWWMSLGMPHTKGTGLEDWITTTYRDAVCFRQGETSEDGFLVRGSAVMHFGFDHDSVESAYEMLPPVRDNLEDVLIVSRFRHSRNFR